MRIYRNDRGIKFLAGPPWRLEYDARTIRRYFRESLVGSYRVNKITSVIEAHEDPRGLEQYVKIVLRCTSVRVCMRICVSMHVYTCFVC